MVRLQYLRFSLFEMYVSVDFVIRCLYSAVSLTLVREQRFIKKRRVLSPQSGVCRDKNMGKM